MNHARPGDLDQTIGQDLREPADEHAHQVEQRDPGLRGCDPSASTDQSIDISIRLRSACSR
jgi:hypothetical protein